MAPIPAPVLLLVALDARDSTAARLPGALAAAGIEVAALCPDDSLMTASRHLAHHFHLDRNGSRRHIARRLARAMAELRPALVLPCDARAVSCLHALVRTADPRRGPLDRAQIAALTDCLGDPVFLDALRIPDETQALARWLGLAAPPVLPVRDAAGARAAADHLGRPGLVEPVSVTAGPQTVTCRTDAEIDAALAPLVRRAGLARSVRRFLPGGDRAAAAPVARVRPVADGQPATVSAVAWRGEMLAAVTILPRTPEAGGVIDLTAHGEMEAAAALLIAAGGVSGFIDIAFRIERKTGRALLTGCTPRPGPFSHLGGRIGADLAGALAARLRGEPPEDPRPRIPAEVALFPAGRSAAWPGILLDVPADDPGLVTALLATLPPDRSAARTPPRPSAAGRILRLLTALPGRPAAAVPRPGLLT